MSLSTKILIALGVILTLGGLSFIIYHQSQISKAQTAIQTSIVAQQQLIDGIVRSQNQYATKDDITKFAQDNGINLKAVQDNLDKLNAQVSSINVITADSDGQNGTNLPSTNTGPTNPNPPSAQVINCPNGGTVTCPNPDPYGYMKAQQNLALNEDFGTLKVPFGTVGFSAWQPAPWDIHISPRDYNVDTVVGTDENQRQYFYNKFSVKVGDQTYEIPIKTANTKQEYPSAKFSFWNPRLLLGVDGGINLNHMQGEFAPSINVGLMSYGQYKTTPDFSILEVGAAWEVANQKPAFIVTPFAYNIGKNIFSPLMNNTYIGPSVMFATDGSWTAGGGLRVGF